MTEGQVWEHKGGMNVTLYKGWNIAGSNRRIIRFWEGKWKRKTKTKRERQSIRLGEGIQTRFVLNATQKMHRAIIWQNLWRFARASATDAEISIYLAAQRERNSWRFVETTLQQTQRFSFKPKDLSKGWSWDEPFCLQWAHTKNDAGADAQGVRT